MPRLIVLETALDGLAGHFYQHAIGAALAARELGYETAVYANLRYPAALPGEGVRVVPWFERPMDAAVSPAEGARRFADALERLASAERLTAEDALCLNTTSARHLEGLLLWHQRPAQRPRPFLLVLLMFDPASEPMCAATRPAGALLGELAAAGWAAHGACFAPEPALPGAYAAVSPLPVHALPLAVRSDRAYDARPVPAPPPLTVSCLGDARQEKGYLLLPGLARALYPAHGAAGRLRFVIQTAGAYSVLADMRAATAELRTLPPGYVTLIESAPATEAYYRLLAETDIVLCPYSGDYRSKVSGVLTEALAAGKPAVVPAHGSLGALLPPDCGATFDSADGIAPALESLLARYETVRAAARAGAPEQRRLHSHRHALERMLAVRDAARVPGT